MLVDRALSDDDIEVRELASTIVSHITRSTYPLCRDKAAKEWWSYMQVTFCGLREWETTLLGLLNDESTLGECQRGM